MSGKIVGRPQSKYNFEFMVVRSRSDGDWDWCADFETAEAYDYAKEIDGVVVHNLRVSHKEKVRG